MSDPGRRGRGGIGAGVWWRQVRADVSADVVIAVVVALTVFAMAAAPRLLEHASRADLRDTIATATPEQRNLRFDARTEIGAGPPRDPFLNIDVFGQRLSDDLLPESVTSLTNGEQWVVDSPEFEVTSFPDEEAGPFPTTFRLRYQQGIEQRSRLVSGTAPEARDPILRLEGLECPEGVDPAAFEEDEDVDCELVVLPLFEVAVTQQTADDMMVEIGDRVTLRPEPTDLSFRTLERNPASIRLVVQVAGIVELDDPSLEYWYADSSLHRPRVTENPDFRLVFAVGLMSPDQYRGLRGAVPGATMSFSWRYVIDPTLVEQADADLLRDDIEQIAPIDVNLVTGLPELLGTHLAQRRLATLLLSIAAVGIAAAALAAIWVLTAVDGVRRQPVTSLLVDRGASRVQLAVHAARTGAAVVAPAAAVAMVAAWALIPDTSASPTWLPVGIVSIVAMAAIVLAGSAASAHIDVERRRLRRVVAEVLVVVAALGSVVLVRRRDSSVADGAERGFDALVAAAPALVAVAAGLVLVRLVGPVAALLARLAAKRRRASAFVGVRRLSVQTGPLRAPVVAIAIAAAAAVFAAVVSVSLDRGRELASWQSVGGDRRIETGNPSIPIPAPLQDAFTDRPARPAYAASLPVQRFEGTGGSYVSDVFAVDVAAYTGVVGADRLDELVDTPLGRLSDTEADVVSAMLVAGRPGPNTPQVGDTISLERGAFVVPIEVVATSARFPGVAIGRPTIVVDRPSLGGATDQRTVAPTVAFLDDSALSTQTQALLDDPRSFVRVTSRADRLAEIAGDPLSSWTSRSVWMLGGAGLVLAIVTVAAAAVITASARRRDLGVLAVLGLERRATGRVIAIELLPGTALAAFGGAAAGASTVVALGSNLSLGAFAGADDAATVVLSWPVVGAVVGGLLGALTATVVATVRSVRRIDHAMLLRKGDL